MLNRTRKKSSNFLLLARYIMSLYFIYELLKSRMEGDEIGDRAGNVSRLCQLRTVPLLAVLIGD